MSEEYDTDSGSDIPDTDATLFQEAQKVDFSNRSKSEEFFTGNLGAFIAQRTLGRNILHDMAENVPNAKDRIQYETFLDCLLERHGSLLKSQTEDGDTPLHCAFSKKNSVFVRIVLANKEIKDIGRIFELQTKSFDNVLSCAIRASYKGIDTMIRRYLPSTFAFEQRDLYGNTLLHIAATRNPPDQQREERQLDLVNLLMESSVGAITSKNYANNTPFQEREALLGGVVANDPIANCIKIFCLRHLSRLEAIDALYKAGKERQIEFDLFGLQDPVVSATYLGNLSTHLKLDSVLKYVALPKLSAKFGGNSNAKRKVLQKGLEDMLVVFEWLSCQNVRKIIKVMVVDNGDVAHTDEVIEKCLRPFQIEIWDWKRVDLCADVVRNAAGSSIRELFLYSSGNNTVLTGWSSSVGFANAENFPKLKKVTLYIQKGLERQEILFRYLERFQQRLKSAFLHPREMVVDCVFDIDTYSYTEGPITPESTLETGHVWLKTMERFTELIYRLPFDPEQDIKIAIIDDGVDTFLPFFEGKIAAGRSFCSYSESKDLTRAYFVPLDTCNGTIMAYLICQICPRVKLYIAKLNEETDIHNERQITAESAAAVSSTRTSYYHRF
ncbi:hypothetical protein TWF694_010099 [Orbilia ellipsospora]|uniref:Ankyrin repeat protein n=1 Tax=Orbilia ellipsospora TaxID=2528407 RepID=A0AAV9X9V5_9PEZI